MVSTLFKVLDKDNLQFASTIIGTLADILSIKEFIAGKKPESIKNKNSDSIIIKNKDGQVKIASKKAGDIIFNNPTVNVTINNTFHTLQGIDQIEGLSIKDNKGNSKFKTTRNDFEKLSSPNEVIEDKTKDSKTIIKYSVPLNVFKIVFGQKYKWEFYYDGKKISATIEDENFYKKLLNRQIQFMNGDILIADQEIDQVFNEIANTYENKKYIIKLVRDIKQHPKQFRLNFKDE
jgi:paraquat-inducible protein B